MLGHHPVIHRVDHGQWQRQQIHADAAQQENQRQRQRPSGQHPRQHGRDQRSDSQPRENRVRARHGYDLPFSPRWIIACAPPGVPAEYPASRRSWTTTSSQVHAIVDWAWAAFSTGDRPAVATEMCTPPARGGIMKVEPACGREAETIMAWF